MHLLNERNNELAAEVKRLREEILIARSNDGTHEVLAAKLELLMHDNRMLRHQLLTPAVEDVHPADSLGACVPERTHRVPSEMEGALAAATDRPEHAADLHAERRAALQNLAAQLAKVREDAAAKTAERKTVASRLSATVAASHTLVKSLTPVSAYPGPTTAELCALRGAIKDAKLANLASARKPATSPSLVRHARASASERPH
jgi:hypothetical protein